jgi:deoxycytidylate deaminase
VAREVNYFNTKAKNETVFNKLFEAAETVTDCDQHRHAAAIVYKKQILSIGRNQLKTHPIMLKYQTDKYKIYLHAEIDAIIKTINQYGSDVLKRCDLYVMRLTGGGNIGMSKPCQGCQKAIDAFGIKGVYWT